MGLAYLPAAETSHSRVVTQKFSTEAGGFVNQSNCRYFRQEINFVLFFNAQVSDNTHE